jgi:hypothetical protein
MSLHTVRTVSIAVAVLYLLSLPDNTLAAAQVWPGAGAAQQHSTEVVRLPAKGLWSAPSELQAYPTGFAYGSVAQGT